MRILSAFILLFSLLSVAAYAADEAPTFNQVVIFGDSLSDNGNLYSSSFHLIPKSPPYYAGRFSNGKTWADLAEDYFTAKGNIKLVNYAVGGETAVFHNPFEGFLPYTFTESLNSYYLHTILQDKSHTLFIIWIGANDYLNGSNDPEGATTTVVATIRENIESLISKGGRSFLILNLPDLSMTPMAAAYPNVVNLHALSVLHNKKLQAIVDSLQVMHHDIIIHTQDVYGIYNDLSAHPEKYNEKYHTHISDLTTSCWTGGYMLRASRNNREEAILHSLQKDYSQRFGVAAANATPNLKGLAHYIATSPALLTAYEVGQQYESGGTVCADPDSHGFWDHVHPSAATHQIIGGFLIEAIDQYYHFG